MLNIFVPDLYFDTVYDITPELLVESGIKFLLLDIDNTLVTYDDPVPTESVCKWFESLQNIGVKCAFVSNNHAERVNKFAEKTSYPAFHDAHKPFVSDANKALKCLGADIEHTAVVGDQIFTDILMGKRLGTFTVLVKPINDKRDIFTRFKRLMEKPVLCLYHKLR